MKKIEAAKDIGHYMALPYTIILRPDEDGDLVAQIKELPGCLAHGQDANEALETLKEFQHAWIERRIESGQSVPEPEDEEDLPSGKWVQRVPRSLHQKLSQRAKCEGVSLNQLATSMLSEAIGAKHVEKVIEDLLVKGITPTFYTRHR
jgi:antitoxin HicB